MAEDNNKLSAEMIDRVFDTAQRDVIDNIAGNTNDKEVAKPLVKDDLRGDTGIGTAYNDSKRFLALCDFTTSFLALIWMRLFCRNKSFISFNQLLELLTNFGIVEHSGLPSRFFSIIKDQRQIIKA
jgi:hypothetical protein